MKEKHFQLLILSPPKRIWGIKMEKVSTYGYSDIGSRQKNEDNGGIYIYGKNLVAIVADGLGGQGKGDAASLAALTELSRCGSLGELPDKTMLESYFQRANEVIIKKQQNQFQMKTTAVYLCIHDNCAIWAHIGDSRFYHFYRGELCHFTLDHSMSQLAVTLGEISRSEIPGHSERSCLLRALGCEEIKPEIHETITLQPGKHAFLLCTDGFWEYLHENELSEGLAQTKTAQEWIAFLCSRIEERHGEEYDNNTAMAIFLEV